MAKKRYGNSKGPMVPSAKKKYAGMHGERYYASYPMLPFLGMDYYNNPLERIDKQRSSDVRQAKKINSSTPF